MRSIHLDRWFPHTSHLGIAMFWLRYWCLFLLLLPALLLMQVVDMLAHGAALLWTWNRRFDLLDGKLRLVFLNNWRPLLASLIWGERFLMVDYRGLVVDPGPVCTRSAVDRHFRRHGSRVRAVVVTHEHEEHIGNAAHAARQLDVPVLGSARTLAALQQPERLSLPRRTFIGQPEPAHAVRTRAIEHTLEAEGRTLKVIESPGHCDGHVALYDPQEKLLIAGDSFLHTFFTAPNADVSGEAWVRTLEAYRRLDIRTMVGGHGCVYTIDRRLRSIPFVVRRRDPNALIRRKLAFLRLQRRVVVAGESRRLPYSVIEACAFPWSRPWTWRNWFKDEAIRLFSAGEFSRTHFIRSLAPCPGRIGPRFPVIAALVEQVRCPSAGAAR